MTCPLTVSGPRPRCSVLSQRKNLISHQRRGRFSVGSTAMIIVRLKNRKKRLSKNNFSTTIIQTINLLLRYSAAGSGARVGAVFTIGCAFTPDGPRARARDTVNIKTANWYGFIGGTRVGWTAPLFWGWGGVKGWPSTGATQQ